MTTCICWSIPSPRQKRSYLIEIVDQKTHRWGRCVFQSECSHGMQEWAQTLADHGQLILHDEHDEKFWSTDPLVVNVDDKVAAHLPIVDPVN
jgi:hypothetical protein